MTPNHSWRSRFLQAAHLSFGFTMMRLKGVSQPVGVDRLRQLGKSRQNLFFGEIDILESLMK